MVSDPTAEPSAARDKLPDPLLRPFRTSVLEGFSQGGAGRPRESTVFEKLLGMEARWPDIRQSNVLDWLLCPRYFMWKHRFGVEPRHYRRSEALDIGTFFHTYMACHYLGLDEGRAVSVVGAMIEEAIEQELTFEDKGPLVDRLSGLTRSLERGSAMARMMARLFLARFPLHPAYKAVCTELNLRARQTGISQTINGTLDLVLLDTSRNEVWIADHKTCKEPPMDRIRTVAFEPQTAVYPILLQTAIDDGKVPGLDPGTPVVGFTHNVVRKPSIILRTKDSFEEYLERCEDYYEGRGEFEAAKGERTLSPPMLQNWMRITTTTLTTEQQSLLYEVGRACKANPDSARYYRNPGACFKWGKPCAYLPLCEKRDDELPALLAEEYRVTDV